MFPVMLSLSGKRCLVVGGGGVALRKVQGLVEEDARVTVVSPDAAQPLLDLAAKGEVHLERRRYRDGEAGGFALVFAATDDREVNRQVFRDAEAAGVWVNVADDPELCTFHLPARVRRGPLQLAVASEGSAPFMVRRLRQVLENRLGPEWSEWTEAAARFRTAVRARRLDASEEAACFDRFFAATVDAERLRVRVPHPGEEASWLPGSPPEDRAAATRRAPVCRSAEDGLGLVSLVGAGPGEPGLLTVRGLRRLREARAVVYDRLAATTLPVDLDRTVELHPVGKTAGVHPVPQDEINALLVRLAREGKRVVRLKGGDPFVFGRGGEEAEVLAAEGVPFEVVPGVTSGVAAAAWAGIPVTHRREAVRVTLVTAHEAIKRDGRQVRWDLMAQDPHATIVGYMGVTALPNVVDELLAWGMDPETPAAMIQQGTTAAQRRVISTVRELPRAVEEAGIGPPALFVIGPTVGHAERLDWFARLPLAGQRLVVPMAADDLAGVLEAAGAEVVDLPSPVTPAARVVMAALPLSGCVVRSPAEVDWLDDERELARWTPEAVTWCLGEATAARARERGWGRVEEMEVGLLCTEMVARLAAR